MGMMAFFTRKDATLSTMRPETQREAIVASLLVTAWVVEARDPYTGGHLWRMARYAALLGERAGMTPDQCAQVALAAFVHDIGKAHVPESILGKREALSDDEFAIIRTHPEMGARMLAGHPYAAMVSDAVLLHHETPDGMGYPRGLKGTSIPATARIVGLCDAFDAMTSARPYRAAMSVDEALSAIESQLGRQFDEFLGRHFLALGREGVLERIVGHGDEGLPLQSCARCGPTLVVRREHRAGDTLVCPACGARHRLMALGASRSGPLKAEPTGEMGTALERMPDPDMMLIRRFVQESIGLAVQQAYAVA